METKKKLKKTFAKTSLKVPTAKKQIKKKARKPVTKKVTKKTAPKKLLSKRKIGSKQKTEKVLICADDETCFWTTDGQILKDMKQLKEALENMDGKVFAHHVTKEKNDFADWVENVLIDSTCATDIRKSKKQNTTQTVIIRHLRKYKL